MEEKCAAMPNSVVPRPLLVSLAVLVVAAFPASAHAAVTITGVQVQPTTTAAGGHPDLTIDTTFSQNPESDDLKGLRVLLPQGLVGDPNAADHCSQSAFGADTCPASSKVGTAQVSAVITVPPGIDTSQTSPGDIYLLDPQDSEPARLGLVVRPQAIGIFSPPKIFLQSGITLGPDTNYGLSSTFDNIPRSDGGFDIRITETKLTLNGMAAHGPFISNPTDCRQATISVSATSYDESGTSSGSGSFTPTACDALAFAPAVSGTVGGPGLTAKNTSPILTSLISLPAGQANPSTVKIVLPATVAPNISQVGRACPPDVFAASNCPSNARVGSVEATSPLLPAALQGPVQLVARQGGILPQLAILIGGAVPITLVGDVGLETGRITNTFTGIPDLPLSRFQLTVDGGQGLLRNQSDLCAPGAGGTVDGTITAHSGRTATISGRLAVQGCVPGSATATAKPRASMRILFGSKGGVLTAHFKAGNGAPPLTKAQLTLAPGLKGRKKGAVVSEAKRLGRRALSLRGRRLTAKLTRKGAVSVAVRWRGLKASRKVAAKIASRTPLKFVALLTDASGR